MSDLRAFLPAMGQMFREFGACVWEALRDFGSAVAETIEDSVWLMRQGRDD